MPSIDRNPRQRAKNNCLLQHGFLQTCTGAFFIEPKVGEATKHQKITITFSECRDGVSGGKLYVIPPRWLVSEAPGKKNVARVGQVDPLQVFHLQIELQKDHLQIDCLQIDHLHINHLQIYHLPIDDLLTVRLQIDNLQIDHLQIDHLQIYHLQIYHLQIDHLHIYHLQIDNLQIDNLDPNLYSTDPSHRKHFLR